MKFIRSAREIRPVKANGKTIVYMLGYGGRIWHAARHLKVLQNEGFTILVIDFVDILKRRNPQDLVDLMDEVSDFLSKEKLLSNDTLIVGVSLGGLVGYNLIKRHSQLTKLLVVTGGDMTRIPSRRSLAKQWRITREKLTEHWRDVNIYTPAGQIKGKHIVMLLPQRDRVIDPDEVAREIASHTQLNDFTIVRTKGGHFRTIIRETIISPKKSLEIIKQLARF